MAKSVSYATPLIIASGEQHCRSCSDVLDGTEPHDFRLSLTGNTGMLESYRFSSVHCINKHFTKVFLDSGLQTPAKRQHSGITVATGTVQEPKPFCDSVEFPRL